MKHPDNEIHLGNIYSSIEEARHMAEVGRYCESRVIFKEVIGGITKALTIMEGTELKKKWQECLRALTEEVQLVMACEDEVAAMQMGGDKVVAPTQQNHLPKAVALDYDTSGNIVKTRSRAPRNYCKSEDGHDPLKWRPPSPAPNGFSAPSSPAHYRRLSDRTATSSRHARHATHNHPQARNGQAAVAPKVNSWRSSKKDPKAVLIDQVVSRFGTSEQELVEQLGKDMIDATPGVQWSDIAGLKAAKQVLNEHVSLPLKMPAVFTGQLLRPCKGVLLFGPPGTGKTMLAKAVATECQTTFFNVSTSTLASKFRGESEKLVRILFEMARAAAPSVIFIDEIDSMCSSRGAQSEHEASRRMKTELLTQVDGMHTSMNGESCRVMVLAATNFPWDIDEALRRRLEKRVYIPLPSQPERVELLSLCLKGAKLAESVDLDLIASRTEGFSGDDISNVCRDAAFNVVRRQMLGRSFSTPEKLQQLQTDLVNNIVIEAVDFEHALSRIHPSCSSEDIKRHTEFANTFGAT